MPAERYCAPTVFDPPAYSQGVRVTGPGTTLYLSGQVAQDARGNLVGRGDFPAQARQTLQNLRAMVEAGGGTLDDVVKLTVYLTDVRYRPDLVPIREEFFGPKLPASTLVTTPALAHPDYMIEIEAVAFVPDGAGPRPPAAGGPGGGPVRRRRAGGR
jgi:enamine deaminase RidA (YjgF/YER057c/UK114 family)